MSLSATFKALIARYPGGGGGGGGGGSTRPHRIYIIFVQKKAAPVHERYASPEERSAMIPLLASVEHYHAA